ATAEANNLAALAAAKDYYQQAMEELCGGDKAYLAPSKLQERHLVYRETAVEKFRSMRKMGGRGLSQRYQEQLEAEIDELLDSYAKFNRSKNFASLVRTPAAMLLIIVSMHLLSGFVGLLGLGFLTVLFDFFNGMALLTLMSWLYIKYTGQGPLLGEVIDAVSDSILGGVANLIISRYFSMPPNTVLVGLAHAAGRS
ncbi:atlastin-2-like, partial [Mobula birostris]|uniref:atlastin-2-like n=1 Tax=Mobula birostris TaxID=1983395 RepID=UPI003B284550